MAPYTVPPVRRISRAVLFILLAAFALRAYRLDAQSLWYDEGLSVYLASLPLSETIAQSAVTDHPPLHAVLLNLWMRVAGSSEFSARFVSVFFGTLVVALTYALARRAGGRRVGAIAAGLMTISPMAVWYSQEVRGYSLLITLILIAILACLGLVIGDYRRRVWLTYVLACAAAMYTHYFAAFPIIALNLSFIAHITYSVMRISCSADSAIRNPTPLRPSTSLRTGFGDYSTQYTIRNWLLAQVAIALLFLPWLPNALAQAASNATYFPGRVTWDTVVLDTWRAFAAGEFPQPLSTGPLWLAVILLGIAQSLANRLPRPTPTLPHSHTPTPTPTLTLTLLLPLLLMSLLAWDKPKFAPRYLLPSLPAFVTLAALGIDAFLRLRSRAGITRSVPRLLALTVLLLILLIPATDLFVTARIYVDPSVARPDMRSVAGYIVANDEPGDAILLVGGHQWPVFEYYYGGEAKVVPLPPDVLPAAQSPLDVRVVSQLANIATAHPRAWLVLWQQDIADPTGVILSELLTQARRLEVSQNFHEVSLLLFDLRGTNFTIKPQRTLNVMFTGPIRLVGLDLNSNQILAGQDLKFTLYFELDGPIGPDYRIFTHLIGPDGSLAAQDDRIAGSDSYPTSLWATGARIRNTFNIRVPSDLPPGAYRLLAGLYDDSGRLRLSGGGDAVELATIAVSRSMRFLIRIIPLQNVGRAKWSTADE